MYLQQPLLLPSPLRLRRRAAAEEAKLLPEIPTLHLDLNAAHSGCLLRLRGTRVVVWTVAWIRQFFSRDLGFCGGKIR